MLTALADEIALSRASTSTSSSCGSASGCEVDWDVDTAPEDALVPPLLLQPLVENAVYHGIEPGAGPAIVLAHRARRRPGARRTDQPVSSASISIAQGNRMALANIRERLHCISTPRRGCDSGAEGGRYRIEMDMPYRRA